MVAFLQRARTATVIAAAGALLGVGVVAGAAGDFMVVGASNNSGASQTILLTTAGGASFTMKNTTNGKTGQFGWSSGVTGAGRGLYGRSDSPDGFGVDAWNSAAAGTGAGLRARADHNVALAVSAADNTGETVSSGCSTFLCGSTGINSSGGGLFGIGVYGSGGTGLS